MPISLVLEKLLISEYKAQLKLHKIYIFILFKRFSSIYAYSIWLDVMLYR